MEGFQLWLNLPASDKLCEPWYRDIPAQEIPRFTTPEGVAVRVIAGASHGVAGAVQRERTEPLYLDLALPAGAVFRQSLAPGHNAFACVYRGTVEVLDAEGAATPVASGRMAILGQQGDGAVLRAAGGPARALLIAGRPLREPIAQHGPFVMNSRDQLIQAVQDFQAGRFG